MFLLNLIHPFGRLSRGGYFVAVVFLLAIAAVGLWIMIYGEIYRDLGRLFLYPALWGLLMAMINRTRDARASPGWVVWPMILSAGAIFAVLQMFAGSAPQPNAVTGKTAPGEVFNWLAVYGVWLWISAMVSVVFWLLGIVMLATFPSRAAAPKKLRIS